MREALKEKAVLLSDRDPGVKILQMEGEIPKGQNENDL